MIIWDRGGSFSKFIDRGSYRGGSHRGTWTGCFECLILQFYGIPLSVTVNFKRVYQVALTFFNEIYYIFIVLLKF